MLHSTVELGPFAFQHADYDRDHDVLYLFPDEPCLGDDDHRTPEGHMVCYDGDTGELVTVVLMDPRKALEHDRGVTVTIPGAADYVAQLTTEELAPILMAA